MKKTLKRGISFILTLVMILSVFPQFTVPATAVGDPNYSFGTTNSGDGWNNRTGLPNTCSGRAVVALFFNGDTFPGEPRRHDGANYLKYNTSFERADGNFKASEILQGVLESDSYVMGENSQLFGYYLSATSGIFDPNGLDDEYFTDNFNAALAVHEQDMISDVIAAKKNAGQAVGSENPTDYEIVWYLVKYQTIDSTWHINGLIREKDKYSVLYDGNGATAGSPPDGVIDMSYSAARNYTVQTNADGLSRGNQYNFIGWNTKADGSGIFYSAGQKNVDLTAVGENPITLYAQWAEKNKVNVTWIDGDNKTIHIDADLVSGDQVAIYDGAMPTRLPTNDLTYTFNGTWKDANGNEVTLPITMGNSNITLYAQFDSAPRTYTVTWVNHTVIKTDSGLEYEDSVSYDGAIPTRSTTETEGYLFAGWSKSENGAVNYALRDSITVEGDMTLYAQFTLVPMRTVTWYNEDGTEQLATLRALEGSAVSYPKELPAKVGNVFAGWASSANGSAAHAPGASITVSGNMDLYADFEPTKHTVIWKNWDGSVLETDSDVPYGTTPVYNGSTPTRADDVDKTYTHIGWTPAINPVTGDITYTATFAETVRAYTVIWKNYDGSVLKNEQVNHGVTPSYTGATPVCPETATHSHQFIGWTPEVSAVPGNADGSGTIVYTAKFQEVEKLFTATVKVWKDPIVDDKSGLVTSGTLADIDDVTSHNALYLRNLSSRVVSAALSKTATGVYTIDMAHGNYEVVVSDGAGGYTRIIEERIVLPLDGASSDPDSTSADIIFYSVTYDFDGGTVGGDSSKVEYYQRGTDVTVSNYVPTYSQHIFNNWQLDENTTDTYVSGQRITILGGGIVKSHTLTAKWVRANDNVNINLTIHHHADPALSGAIGMNPEVQKATPNMPELGLDLSYRPEGSSGDYWEEGKKFSSSDWYTKGITTDSTDEYNSATYDTKTTTISFSANTTGFEGLSHVWDYSANILLKDYFLTERNVVETVDPVTGDATYTVNATLQYRPDLFNMGYTVEIDQATIDAGLTPTAVDLKILSYKDGAWSPISRHQSTSLEARFDGSSVPVSGSYGVPVKDQLNNDFYYRISVVGFTLPDGTELSATGGLVNYSSSATGSIATYKYAAGAYTAEVTVTSDKTAVDGKEGVYGVSGYEQSGTVTVTVYANPHTVTFNPNGGTLDGNTTPTVVNNQFRIPVLGDYIPTREGNYVFDGWYVADGEGNMTNEAAVTGEAITENKTLIAKWKAPMTVSGEIRLNTHYIVGGNAVAIPTHDLPQKLTVTLERTTASGDKIIVQVKEISGIDYTSYAANHLGWASYAFDPVPQDGSTYRVYVAGVNYEEKFLNEPEANSDANITDYSQYGADHDVVDYDGNNKAAVHIVLTFEPADYDLTWEVDSSAIADAFRPESLDILIQCNANDGTPNYANWPVITQHYHGGNYYPEITELTSDTVTDFFPVWRINAKGEAYDYAVRVHAWNDGSSTVSYNSATAPFTVTYSPAVAWYEGGQQVTADALENSIVVRLTPKTYNISYDLNAGGESVDNMGGAPTNHTWGIETSGIPMNPTRTGYDFLGWTSSNPGAYADGKISAETAGDITLTANWSKQKVVTFKVVNGTWSDDSTADIPCYVSLDGSGNGSVAIPSGMKADYGYGNGNWNDPALVGASLAVSGSEPVTYTYSFVRLYHNVSYDTDGNGAYASDSVAHGNYVRVDPASGVWNENFSAKDVRIEEALALANPTRDGYIFAGWHRHYMEDTTTYPGSTIVQRYVAQWLRDENGDGVADILQKKIIFNIENGTWDGTNSDPIVEFVTLDGSGKADISSVIPTGMQPRTGFVSDDAFWSPALPAGNIVSGNGEISFTYHHYTTITYSDFTQNRNLEQLLILPGSYIGIDPAGGSWDENTSQTITQINGPYVLEDAVYTSHDFLGWQLNTTSGEAAHIFTAQWKKDSYTILWKNDDGNLLETDENVELGTMPEYNGAEPTKASTAEFDYTFKGWTPEVIAAEANTTYTAEFTATRRSYTVTWKNWDGSVLDTDTVEYGELPAYAGTPGRPATAEHSYAFTGWTPDVAVVTGDAEYTATYSETTNKYTVTWVDSDGTVLETDKNVPYGTAPSYDDHSGTTASLAEAKTLASAGQYTYTFAGWTPSISNVTGSVTYKASYTRTLNAYTVTWVDSDGSTVLETDTGVPYGTMPSYNNTAGTTAALAAAKGDEQYTYVFNGWTPVISKVTGNVTYQATYSQTPNKYTVTWKHSSGATLKTETVSYGDMPTAPADPTRPATSHYSYTFSGWSPTVSAVTGDVTYTAQFTPVQILFTGTVNVHLNNAPITAPMTVETLLNGAKMYLGNGEQGHATEYYLLTQSATQTHVYSNSNLSNGEYYVYSSSDGVNFTQLCEQMLTIENDSRSRESYFYSVSYDANGGTGAPTTAYYHKDHGVSISSTVPTRTGYVFVGWKVNGGEVKQPGAALTGSITVPYTLVAQWVEAVDIKVNVVIGHTSALGNDSSAAKGDITIELVSRPNDTAPWIEVAGTILPLSESGHAKHDYVSSDTQTTYTANAVTYDGTTLALRGDRLYSLTAIKEGYELQSVTWNDSTKTLNVALKYAPEDFGLSFSVETDITDSAVYPSAAIIRVLRWSGSAWEYIPQHAGGNPGVNVIIDPSTGKGSGSVTVRKEQGTPAVADDYRIEVSSLVYDGGIHTLSGSGDVFSNGFYTATVQPVGTIGHRHNDLDGAYWGGSTQMGELKAIIAVSLHKVLFEENGGSTVADLNDQYKLPDLSAGAYQPSRDNGYVFAGWYTDSDCTVPAVSDKRISGDTTLYAKWIEPMTISGTVSVDGYYTYDHDGDPATPAQDTPIPAVGRLDTVTVQLQKLTNPIHKYYSTIKEQSVALNYSDTPAVANADFSFAKIPNDGSTYRIHVLNHSYSVSYKNENGGFAPATDEISSPSIAVDAVPQDDKAVVDVNMSFSPDVFELWYQVDATEIGVGFRPTTAEVLVLCDDDIVNSNSPRLWPVISQMTNNTVPVTYTGDTVNVGTAESFPAWIKHPSGYLYDYAISLQNVDGADFSGKPYTVEYNGSAHYLASGGYEKQSQQLTATLKPKSYPVKYYLEHFGANKDIELHGMTVNAHKWSFETALKNGDAWKDVPTRANHVFNGWVDESGNPVTSIPANTSGDVKLYASWKYTITWLNDDGSLIDTTSVAYGGTPSHADAVKSSSAEYSYSFTGWTPDIEPATRNTSYMAQFSSAKNSYTVTWENYDGTKLDTDTVEYGKMPSYTDATPTKAEDEHYSYTFSGWSPAVSAVTGDVTYTAEFAQAERHYTVTWFNWDGSLLDKDDNLHYNEQPAYSSVAPTRTGDAQHSYSFIGWKRAGDETLYTAPTLPNISGDVTYTAQYEQSVNRYTVTWKNWNGDTLEKDENVPYGTMPTYDSSEPKRTANERYYYTFLGWDKDVSSVTGDITYTAVYTQATQTYTIIWENADGTILETDSSVPFGTTPKYDGATPTKAADAQYTYTFDKWSPEVSTVTGDVTYVATYSTTVNKYTITWKDDDGDVLRTDSVAYGDTPVYGATPTKTGNAQFSYTFDTWTPSVVAVTGNAEYTATYTQQVNSYNIVYTDGVDEDEVFADQSYTVEYGTETPAFVGTPVRSGYSFNGWNPTVSDTVVGNVIYTAQWTANAPVIPIVPPVSTTGTAKLVKVDADDQNSYLKNVVFELHKEDGTLLGEFKTDANGQITVSSLESGEYYWIEICPAEGYVLDSTKHSFTVSAGQTAALTVTNKRSKIPSVFSGEHYAYIVGYSDGKAHPEANITRAEVATIFFRLLDKETREKYLTEENAFSDVESGMWFNTAVSTMAAMGIINGCPDGDFHPNANITRAEFAAIAARFDSNGNTTGASFKDIYGHWAQKEINIAANNGWILGYDNGEFRPNQNITRAEAMAMVNRVLQRIPESKDDLLDEMVKWSDNMDTEKWYYLTVQEATNSHDYGRKNNGYEYWVVIKEVPDWTALEQ